MSDHDGSFEPVLARIVRSIEEIEAQVAQKKRLANELCIEYGHPPRYPDVDAPKAANLGSRARDLFFGRPLATVVREFLEMRGPSNRGGLGAATVNEIYDALVAGGFRFETKDEANAKRGLRIALAKNTATFHKVGIGSGADSYGLTEWYPNVRPPRVRVRPDPDAAQESEDIGGGNESGDD